MSVIKITGKDAASFFRVNLAMIYTRTRWQKLSNILLFYNQGKVLGIFIILKIGDDYIILITTQIVDKIIDKLNMYKLASDVNVALDDNMSIYSTINDVEINTFDKNENFQFKYDDNFIILNNCHGQLLSYIYVTFKKKTKVLKK